MGRSSHLHLLGFCILISLFLIGTAQEQKIPTLCNSSIDTLVETSDGSSYVFKGEHYWMLKKGGLAPGYPRIISQDWPGLPQNIDAAVTWKMIGNTYFFKGDKYWKFTNKTPAPGYPKSISHFSTQLPSNMDAALDWVGNEYIYFFKGSRYWKFVKNEQAISAGYPKQISVGWTNVPDDLDAALHFGADNIYFFKSGDYYHDQWEEDLHRDAGSVWFGCPQKK